METLDKDFSNSDLVISTKSKNFLKYAAKWASFLAIVGFITLGLLVLIGFLMLLIGSQVSGVLGGAPIALFSAIYFGMAALYFFPIYYLFLFGQKIKKAIKSTNQNELDAGFENLKSCFKFLGIFTLVILSLYILMFLVAIAAGAAFR